MNTHKILIVDDNPFVLSGLKQYLRHEGYEITTAGNGTKAIRLLREHRFDLILTDLVMEPVDGTEVIRIAKKLQPGIRVIIMTGYSHNTWATRIETLYADDLITKPCESEEITWKIQRNLKKQTQRSQTRNRPQRKTHSLEPAPAF